MFFRTQTMKGDGGVGWGGGVGGWSWKKALQMHAWCFLFNKVTEWLLCVGLGCLSSVSVLFLLLTVFIVQNLLLLPMKELCDFWLFSRLQEDHPIMSFSVNDSGRLALLNVATQVRRIYLRCYPAKLVLLHRLFIFIFKIYVPSPTVWACLTLHLLKIMWNFIKNRLSIQWCKGSLTGE